MKNNKKVIMSLVVTSLVLITAGVTYAFFSYSRTGTTENAIRMGDITFLYEEIDKQGNGINIEDAVPVSDETGKQGRAFNFRITSTNTVNAPIPYQITARKVTDIENPLPDDAIKVYLTKVDSNDTTQETQVLLEKYSELPTLVYNNHNDEILWTDQVPAGSSNYSQSYRLRMWIAQDTDFSTGQYTDKQFSIKVNVYGGTAMQPEPDAPEITNITVPNGTVSPVVDTTLGYDYVTSELPLNTTNTTLNITTEDANDQVTVERVDGLGLNDTQSNIQRLSTTHNIPLTLTSGDNYFKITVTARSRKKTIKIIKVAVAKSNNATLSGLSIDDCPLNEQFDSNTTTYTCSTSKKNLTVNPQSLYHATWVITGNTGLQSGANTITITVTAQDGHTTKEYTVTATKAETLVFDANTQVNDNIELNYSGTYKKVQFQKAGTYKIELWGAQGGTWENEQPGKSRGGYVSGNITLNSNTDLYLYIGEEGKTQSDLSTFNGGGKGGYGLNQQHHYQYHGQSGGGATDVRYFETTPTSEDLAWDSTLGLNSRIMVAAGGAGASGNGEYSTCGDGSSAGGLIGINGTYRCAHGDQSQYGLGGTQLAGGVSGNNILNGKGTTTPATFGKGSDSNNESANHGSGGGGGGYYGGGAGGGIAYTAHGHGGGGGSSFISGHQGCVAIAQGSTTEPRQVKIAGCDTNPLGTGCSVHYSGLSFTNTKMIDGLGKAWTTSQGGYEQMPNPSGGYYEEGLGNSGSGYARITYLGN